MYKIVNRRVDKHLERSGLSLKQAQLGNYTINYWDSGEDKPVLVILHGFGATTEFQWYKQVKDLSIQYRLILPNLLYFGGSIANTPSFSLKNQVEAMKLLINKLGIKSYYLCGASYGGLVAAELALADNAKVKKLILCDSPIKFLTDGDIKTINETYKISDFTDLLVPNDYKGLKTLLSIAYKNPPRVPKFILKDFYKNMYVSQAEEKKGLLHSIDKEKEFYAKRIYQYQFPVLLIWGGEDKLIPIHIAQQLKEHIGANAQLKVIPNTAHMPNMEDAGAFNKIVLEFLGFKDSEEK